MVTFIQYKDPGSEELKQLLAGLKTCPGTCFFIDLSRSTGIKYEVPVTEWARKLNNTFSFISFLNDFPDNIVKGIGDELMIFIPDGDLKTKSAYNSYYALLEEIHATLYNLSHHPSHGMFLNCKVGIHYCRDVYNISFFKGANDYYGIDIDLTARLMFKAAENKIVMSERFCRKVKADLLSLSLPPDTGCMSKVSGRFAEHFKGIPKMTEYRVIDV